MSETASETDPEKPKVIVAKRKAKRDGVERELFDVMAGNKKITFRELDVVDTFLLSEVAPAGASAQWKNMALLTMVIADIDGAPVYSHDRSVDLTWLRNTMRRAGADGLEAVAAGLAELDPSPADPDAAEAARRSAVGNSSDQLGSPS